MKKKSNMIKINLSCLMALILMTTGLIHASAQSPEELESQMDIIKLDESMIYGEDYNDNKDMAYGNALAELLVTANEMRAEKGLELLTASNIQLAVKALCYDKGTRHVVMLYIPVSQMMSMSSGSYSQFKPDDILDILCDQDNWMEIKGFLSSFKSQGKIKMTGAVTTAVEVPEDAYSILIDDMGGILAILSPKNSVSRINYRTNQSDNESNHSNCKFIVWYK